MTKELPKEVPLRPARPDGPSTPHTANLHPAPARTAPTIQPGRHGSTVLIRYSESKARLGKSWLINVIEVSQKKEPYSTPKIFNTCLG